MPLTRPADDPYWRTCPVSELVWAYRRSAATDAAPEALAEVWIDPDGKPKAQGGTRELLAVFRERRDEVIAWLTSPCADCSNPAGADGPVPASQERLCRSCFMGRARLLAPGGLYDRGLIDERCRRPGESSRVDPGQFPQFVSRDGLPLPADELNRVVPLVPREVEIGNDDLAAEA